MRVYYIFFLLFAYAGVGRSQHASQPTFRVVSYFTAKHDPAHVSFVKEANQWFFEKAVQNNFQYDTTSNWDNLNHDYLADVAVVIFLDTRPEHPDHRKAFREYVEQGGGWLGFHFAAFALKDSRYPDNWPWYHIDFLGTGQYRSNTWRPTAETLRVHAAHPSVEGLPTTFESSPNEWYRWELDLNHNPAIQILLALDESTFPVGTGPKQHEIWHSGFYPVAWTNKNFNMIYMNMGHNDMDYGGTEKELSATFSSKVQAQFVLQSLLWVASRKHR